MNKEQLLKALEENKVVCMEGIPNDPSFLSDEKVRFKLSKVYTLSPYSLYTNNYKLYNVVGRSKMAFTAHVNKRYIRETLCRYVIMIYDVERILKSFKEITIL